MMTKVHYFYLLNFNPWPLITSICSFNIMSSFMMFMKFSNVMVFFISIVNIILGSMIWWMSYSMEFNIKGSSSFNLEQGLKMAMLLFISSEVFFFFSFFWSYFHFFLTPVMEIGLVWPPVLTVTFDWMNVPLINTLILLSSGVSVTVSHMYLMKGAYGKSMMMLITTCLLGIIFTILQAMEYKSSFFMISDCSFGTSFFMLTGFHGIHVLIGTVFLITTFWRNFKLSSSSKEYLSFELASWYWHFVDVVWIFLYFLLYYLNG